MLSGLNSTGKTSFFDAILWGLTGSIARIGSKSSVINRFAELGDARVEIELRSHRGRELKVVRRVSNAEFASEILTVTLDGLRKEGSVARFLLLSELYPEDDGSDETLEAFSRWLTKSVYLEQDRVNAFVAASDEQQRFKIVRELLSAAHLNKLNLELKGARTAWTSETNRRRKEISSMCRSRNDLRERLSDIDGAVDAERLIGESAVCRGPRTPRSDAARSRYLWRTLARRRGLPLWIERSGRSPLSCRPLGCLPPASRECAIRSRRLQTPRTARATRVPRSRS